jgi:protein involved in polysaccharide export with SLBB domain
MLSVTIADLVSTGLETIRTVRVSDSGTISLPLLPNPIPAAGRTEHQLQQEVVQAYIDAKILVDRPQVSVQVAEARGRTYKILGAVARPNTYLILQSDYRLLDALVDAGDVTALGVENIYVVRKPARAGIPSNPPAGREQPDTGPARDPLAPQSRANMPLSVKPVALLQQTPETNRPPQTGSEAEGRYIMVDGKPVLVGNQGTVINAQAQAAQPDAPEPDARPAAAQQAPQAQPQEGGFAFNEPTTGSDNRIIEIPWEELKNGELRYNIVVRPQDLIIVPQPQMGIYYMGGHVANPGAYNIVPGNKVTLMDAVISARMLDQLAIPERTDIIRRTGPDRYMYVRVDLAKIFAGEQPDIYLKDNDKVMVGTNAVAPFLAAFRNAFRVTYGFGFLYDRNFAPAREFEGQ